MHSDSKYPICHFHRDVTGGGFVSHTYNVPHGPLQAHHMRPEEEVILCHFQYGKTILAPQLSSMSRTRGA